MPLFFDGFWFPSSSRAKSMEVFLEGVRRSGNVSTLVLRRISLDIKSQTKVGLALRANPSLRKFTLSSVSGANSDMIELWQSLVDATLSLEDLTIDDYILQEQEASVLQRVLKTSSLKVLNFLNMPFSTSSIGILCALFDAGSSIRQLKFVGIQMSKECWSQLFASLSRSAALESLFLENCGIGPALVEDIDRFLSINTSLQTLYLNSNEIDESMIGKWSISGLIKNRSLKKLMLSQNPVGDDGARHLSRMLKSNRTIETLSIVNCDIWSPGCHFLVSSLAQMRGLENLFIDSEIEEHTSTLIQSLQSNMTIKYICTDRSPYLTREDQEWGIVEFYLRLNRERRRVLAEPFVVSSLWPQILERVNDCPALIYYMITHKPDLVAR